MPKYGSVKFYRLKAGEMGIKCGRFAPGEERVPYCKRDEAHCKQKAPAFQALLSADRRLLTASCALRH